jgi:uncharacterized protein
MAVGYGQSQNVGCGRQVMKWQGRRESQNVEDRRRSGGGAAAGGIGGIGVVVVLIVGYFLGIDVTPLLNGLDQGQGSIATSGPVELTPADEQAASFVRVVLGDTEDVWGRILPEQTSQNYTPPTLVLFKGSTPSACGGANAATGPFYCPVDKQVYLDTDFFTVMAQELGAGGDFAAAYVVAHEVGHAVQDQLGILDQANRVRSQSNETQSNAISVRIELQADCFSGVWANAEQEQFGSLERNDIAEAMNAAQNIGDDTLQRNAGGAVRPDSFTHGTSAQRQRWFAMGYDSGQMDQCDTFNASQL